ncbi:MAG: penicillin-binding transpeptidase domain-containing protein [Ginsengibacter sp.]
MNKFRLSLFSFLCLIFGSCSLNHAKINNDLKKYFDSSKVEGCFALLNNQMGDITLYNMELDTQRLPTGTSFKIPETLIGIQSGRITNENTILIHDTSAGGNLTLKQAFEKTSVPYFQEMARQIGKDTLQRWLDSLNYGNQKITSNVESFWMNNELKISPDEQLGFMSKLYFEQLPFQKYAQQTIANLMLQEDDSLYKLSYATGTGIDEKNNSFAWNLGWIEENRHVYFFVTFIRTPEKSTDEEKSVISITKSCLKELGFFQGQK